MRPVTRCSHCNKDISNNNIKKHLQSCTRPKQSVEKRTSWNKGLPAWNRGLTKESDERVAKYTKSVTATLRKDGRPTFGCCSKAYQEKHKEKFLADSKRGGGYRKNSGRSNGGFVIDSFGTRTWLQSSYELKLFEILTELEVRWLRPKPLPYILDGEEKRYYADFYLPDFDLYLEPKNDYLIKKEKKKLEVLVQLYPNVILLDSSKIVKEFIGSIVQRQGARPITGK